MFMENDPSIQPDWMKRQLKTEQLNIDLSKIAEKIEDALVDVETMETFATTPIFNTFSTRVDNEDAEISVSKSVKLLNSPTRPEFSYSVTKCTTDDEGYRTMVQYRWGEERSPVVSTSKRKTEHIYLSYTMPEDIVFESPIRDEDLAEMRQLLTIYMDLDDYEPYRLI